MLNDTIQLALFGDLIKTTLSANGEVNVKVSGISMQPMVYNRRDTVTMVTPPPRLKKGDLPFYKMDDGRFIMHRVIKVHKDGTYECRGDNRWESEDNIRQEQIIGIVTEFTRNGKKHSVKEPLYRFYVLLWPILHYFKKYYKNLRLLKKKAADFKSYLKYLIKPKKITVKLEDGKLHDIKFRKAISADIPKIQRLCADLIEFEEEKFGFKRANKFWFLDDTGKNLFQKYVDNHFLYIAISGGNIVGYIRGDISKNLSLRYSVGCLQNIYISPEYRGVGIGSEFMAQFKNYCLQNGCHTINVTFKEDNINAEEFYKSKGFGKMTKTYTCEL